jgi:hypothetical protein
MSDLVLYFVFSAAGMVVGLGLAAFAVSTAVLGFFAMTW